MINLTDADMQILVHLLRNGRDYIYSVSKSIEIGTYSHVVRRKNKLVAAGLITEPEKSGRKTYFYLTERGKKAAKLLKELNEVLDE